MRLGSDDIQKTKHSIENLVAYFIRMEKNEIRCTDAVGGYRKR